MTHPGSDSSNSAAQESPSVDDGTAVPTADNGAMLKARITTTPFYDPKNLRQRPGVAA